MAYRVFDDVSADSGSNTISGNTHRLTLDDNQTRIELPDSSFVTDAQITRDGADLVLETAEGTVIIEGYYAAEPAPDLAGPDGMMLTPDLVHSFTYGGNEYAAANAGNERRFPCRRGAGSQWPCNRYAAGRHCGNRRDRHACLSGRCHRYGRYGRGQYHVY